MTVPPIDTSIQHDESNPEPLPQNGKLGHFVVTSPPCLPSAESSKTLTNIENIKNEFYGNANEPLIRDQARTFSATPQKTDEKKGAHHAEENYDEDNRKILATSESDTNQLNITEDDQEFFDDASNDLEVLDETEQLSSQFVFQGKSIVLNETEIEAKGIATEKEGIATKEEGIATKKEGSNDEVVGLANEAEEIRSEERGTYRELEMDTKATQARLMETHSSVKRQIVIDELISTGIPQVLDTSFANLNVQKQQKNISFLDLISTNLEDLSFHQDDLLKELLIRTQRSLHQAAQEGLLTRNGRRLTENEVDELFENFKSNFIEYYRDTVQPMLDQMKQEKQAAQGVLNKGGYQKGEGITAPFKKRASHFTHRSDKDPLDLKMFLLVKALIKKDELLASIQKRRKEEGVQSSIDLHEWIILKEILRDVVSKQNLT